MTDTDGVRAPTPTSVSRRPEKNGAPADVLVVGAGVVGASIAFHLTRLGVERVLIVDRGFAGAGMSSRSSALVRMHYSLAAEVDLAVRSLAMFEAWPELVGRPSCLHRTGFVRIVGAGEMELLRANVAMQREHGARTELVSGEELRGLCPGLDVSDVELAAWEPDGGYGDGAVVAGDLVAAAGAGGADYLPGVAVQGLWVESGRVLGVVTDAGPLAAGVVVCATGVWTGPLLAAAGVDVAITPEYHEVAVVANAPGDGAGVACIDSVTRTYFRPEAGDRTLVGAFSGELGADPDNFRQTPRPESLAELVAAAAQRVPALADAGIAGGVTGVYDMTPDARPLLGPVTGLDGLVLAAGFSGMGFKISPAVGRAVAELVVEGRARDIDLHMFRPGRFAEGRPLRAKYEYEDD